MFSSSDEDEFRLWSDADLQAHIMEEFERGFNRLCNSIISDQYPQRQNIETLKHDQYNKLFDIAIRLNKRPNNRENVNARSDLHDLVDHLWHGYEQQLHDAYGRRDRYIEQRINTIAENKNQKFTKRDRVTLLQFYKALLPQSTITKENLERDADKIYTGSQSIMQWYNVYLERLKPPKPRFGTLPVPACEPRPVPRPEPYFYL